MSSVSSQWLTTYAALELSLPITVLHPLLVYWHWVEEAVTLYIHQSQDFPWEDYRNPIIEMLIVRINGVELCYVSERTPELCDAAVRECGRALYYVPQPLRTYELRKLAVQQMGTALQFISSDVEHYDELCSLAVQQDAEALKWVQTH